VIHEIMTTESDYVKDLSIVKNVFYIPIQFTVEGMRPEDLNALFSNVETILGCNQQLVDDWQKSVAQNQEEIDIIVNIFEKMVSKVSVKISPLFYLEISRFRKFI